MLKAGDTTGLDRRGAISMLGSVFAVGALGGCGGASEAGAPTSSSSSSSASTTSSSSLASTNAQCVVTPALTEGPL